MQILHTVSLTQVVTHTLQHQDFISCLNMYQVRPKILITLMLAILATSTLMALRMRPESKNYSRPEVSAPIPAYLNAAEAAYQRSLILNKQDESVFNELSGHVYHGRHIFTSSSRP